MKRAGRATCITYGHSLISDVNTLGSLCCSVGVEVGVVSEVLWGEVSDASGVLRG